MLPRHDQIGAIFTIRGSYLQQKINLSIGVGQEVRMPKRWHDSFPLCLNTVQRRDTLFFLFKFANYFGKNMSHLQCMAHSTSPHNMSHLQCMAHSTSPLNMSHLQCMAHSTSPHNMSHLQSMAHSTSPLN